LAAEDNFPAFNPPSSNAASGDQLSNSKETFFIKLANIRRKNFWKGTDLVIREQTTPSFAMITEKVGTTALLKEPLPIYAELFHTIWVQVCKGI
jgi:hypothetical protein